MSHFAFGHFPLWHLAGWHLAGEGGVLVFRGHRDVASIDWLTPIAGAGASQAECTLPISLEAAAPVVLATQNVAASGQREYGRQSLTVVQIDDGGQLLTPPLLSVHDLTAAAAAPQMLRVEFAYAPGIWGRAQFFEIFGEGGAGAIDFSLPIHVLAAQDSQQEYSCSFDVALVPSRIAVRAVAEGRHGSCRTTIVKHS